MRLLTDFHIHTVSSGHAYSTIEEIIRTAQIKELKAIAITDHGGTMPGSAHPYHFHNLRVVPEKIGELTILKGVESNIIDYEGNIDIPEEILEQLDLVIASFHPPCIAFNEKEEVTRCIEKLMDNPFVQILGHPGDSRYPFDAKRVAKAAKDTHTLLEINNASLKPISFRPGVRENLIDLLEWCSYFKTPVVVNSDAHISYDVGEMREAITLLKEVNFQEELVMNTDPLKLLQFLEKKKAK